MEVKKLHDEKQLVFGEVYAPVALPDSQGDVISADTIEKMAHHFLREMRTKEIDVNHDHERSGAYVVESFIARDEDPDFIPGAWVIGVHVPDPALWDRVKSGELNGFSLEATVEARRREIEIEIPEVIHGETSKAAGHTHPFTVRYSADGGFLGGIAHKGETDHEHVIEAGTRTEKTDSHHHLFSYVDVAASLKDVNDA